MKTELEKEMYRVLKMWKDMFDQWSKAEEGDIVREALKYHKKRIDATEEAIRKYEAEQIIEKEPAVRGFPALIAILDEFGFSQIGKDKFTELFMKWEETKQPDFKPEKQR